jgi:hypothetical protein
MDTGSGKTHIAVLRMKIEAERESNKVLAALKILGRSDLPGSYPGSWPLPGHCANRFNVFSL